MGNKNYELDDHLGNVHVIVTDRKLGVDLDGNGIVDYYVAQIESTSDYYPFGGPLPNKGYSSGYKYGFNGMEKDDEVNGSGNSYDFGERLYNPQLGRFLSTDPLESKYPEISPYHGLLNNPILYLDPTGGENAIYVYIAPYYTVQGKKVPMSRDIRIDIMERVVKYIHQAGYGDLFNINFVDNLISGENLDETDALVALADYTELNTFYGELKYYPIGDNAFTHGSTPRNTFYNYAAAFNNHLDKEYGSDYNTPRGRDVIAYSLVHELTHKLTRKALKSIPSGEEPKHLTENKEDHDDSNLNLMTSGGGGYPHVKYDPERKKVIRGHYSKTSQKRNYDALNRQFGTRARIHKNAIKTKTGAASKKKNSGGNTNYSTTNSAGKAKGS
jgi:RHS repeat-associated protein